ncbi:MAG: M23 family metallopeptidase [Flavobacterium sp.]|nr:M23 family metallopeptidase [Pedobacter sp.]
MLKHFSLYYLGSFLFSFLLLSSCSRSGPGSLFKKSSPHQVYSQKLIETGLDQTGMGKLWLKNSEMSLEKPVSITVPYTETGYFAVENVHVASYRFEAKKGEKLTIQLKKVPKNDFTIFMDLFTNASGEQIKLLVYADTIGSPIIYEVSETGFYILRLQPELLKSGQYTLKIIRGPSLAYPIKAPGKNHIKSFWGDGRDAGLRKHEGVDLFSSYKTPVVASANGTVFRVNETNIGGKVVWLRPLQKNYSLYYAHLDTQLVVAGQIVKEGDTLGLMGNTGNARSTPPHLHFGIYGFGGALDPFPFINPYSKEPDKITALPANLNATLRIKTDNTNLYSSFDRKTALQELPENTLLKVDAVSSNMYKVQLPDGVIGYVNSQFVSAVSKPIKTLTLRSELPLFEKPDTSEAKKFILDSGQPVYVLGNFQNFYFVRDKIKRTGWIMKSEKLKTIY